MDKILIQKLPKWALTAISFIIIGYVGVFGYVAVKTERDVEFWPPKIGPGPKSAAVKQIDGLQPKLIEIKTVLEKELIVLNSRLAEARSNMAEGHNSFGKYNRGEWQDNVSGYERDIKEIQEKLVSKIAALEEKILSLRKSFIELGLIDD